MRRFYYLSVMHREPDNFSDVAGPMSLSQVEQYPVADVANGFFVRWIDVELAAPAEHKPVFSGMLYFYRDFGALETLELGMRWFATHRPESRCTVIVNKEELGAIEQVSHSGIVATIVAGACPRQHLMVGSYDH